MANSVIFIGSPDHNKKTTCSGNFMQLFAVHPYDLAIRIFKSFIPPFKRKYQKVYIDLLGPLLAIISLMGLVTYGSSFKQVQLDLTPVEFIAVQSVLAPLSYFIISRLGQSKISLYETVSLVGYALYGHLVTLSASYVCFQEKSNFFFFVCLGFFGGLSTLRLALVFLGTIPVPVARLVVCSIISLTNLLSLIFLHFAYMHKTFVYNAS